jgi:hypothetical protein
MPIQLPQVRRIEFNDEEIGMGFNSESGLAVGTALEGFTVQGNPVSSGQEVFATVSIVNSHEELMKSMGMSFEAQGRYGFISASAKVQFSESSNYNSTSTFLVARCIVQNSLTRGKNFSVKPSAQALLDAVRFDEFKRAFGDSFVRGLQTGGEFYCVIRITSFSSTQQNDLSLSLQAEFNGLLASGSFKGQYTEANKSTSTKSEYAATMYQKAGSGAQISPTVEISEAIVRFKNFPDIVKTSPVAYETEIATYDTLPLSVPTPEEQEDFLFALRDAREKKLRYIQTKNDLEFAFRNPIFFEELSANDVLLNAINLYTKLINAVMDHAIKLSRGQTKPPRVFDPTEVSPPINEPAPISLQRYRPPAPPAVPTIRVPDMVGLSAMTIEDAWRCISSDSVDDCLSGAALDYGDGIFIGLSISREVAEFFHLVVSGSVRLTIAPSESEVFGGPSVCNAQFPSAGTLLANGSEVILQFSIN